MLDEGNAAFVLPAKSAVIEVWRAGTAYSERIVMGRSRNANRVGRESGNEVNRKEGWP